MKTATIWYVDVADPAAVVRKHPESDHRAARAFAGRMYPDLPVASAGSGALADHAAPDAPRVYIGSFPGLTVVCAAELVSPRPSRVPPAWVRPLASERTYLVATDPARRWGGFAWWERGVLRRAFSATAIHIIEDEGLPGTWELPFWSGRRPQRRPAGALPDPRELPFDPQEFADGASRTWLGFGFTVPEEGGDVEAPDPAEIVLSGFRLDGIDESPAQPVQFVAPDDQHRRRWFRRKPARA